MKGEKKGLFNKWFWDNCLSMWIKTIMPLAKTDPHHTKYINTKQIKDLNVQSKTIKLKRKSRRIYPETQDKERSQENENINCNIFIQ